MLMKQGFIIGIAVVLWLSSQGLVFSQDNPEQSSSPQLSNVEESLDELDIKWMWADVVSVDLDKKQLNLKTFDYEQETEKEIIISVDDKTSYEVIKSLDEIKPGDTVSIDYITTAKGESIARIIRVEEPVGLETTESD